MRLCDIFYLRYIFHQGKGEGESATDPPVCLLGSGSDHAPFAYAAGVPAVDLRFLPDHKAQPGLDSSGGEGHPTQHTAYETFHLVDRLVDPEFRMHRICAQTTIRWFDASILYLSAKIFETAISRGKFRLIVPFVALVK